jgi:hypothetical protein
MPAFDNVEEYWGDPSGNIRRMAGEQEIIATITNECTEAEWRALCAIKLENRNERF